MSKNAKAGLWIEKMKPEIPGEDTALSMDDSTTEISVNRYRGMSPEMLKRYGLLMPGASAAAAAPTEEGATETPKAPTNEIATINLRMAAINLKRYGVAGANNDLMNQFRFQLQSRTNVFAAGTDLGKTYTDPEASDVTFNFDVVLKLARPIKQ
jgi:hypothetical protein